MSQGQDKAQSGDSLDKQRREDDKDRPNQCQCGHSRAAHDSGYSFCWFCNCDTFKFPPQALDAALAQGKEEK